VAIINGTVPPSKEHTVNAVRRVVVKFRPGTRLPYSSAAPEELARTSAGWNELAATYPGVRLVPYFSTIPEETLRALSRPSAQSERTSVAPNFALYYAIECPPEVDAASVVRSVSAWPNVETAYLEGGPTPPPVNPSDDPRNANQGYQDAAPAGIDVRWAWGVADGYGIGFVDMERGWTLNHEDLAAANIGIISGVNQDFQGHGTAVLGEVVAVDNMTGGVGIAPRASARVVSQWRSSTNYNTAEAILSATGYMSAGDVMLLEAQTSHPNATGFVPVEVEQAAFDAISAATAKGIIVVEAGANGSVDLDDFQDSSNKKILNRNSNDFRDSGAILVGAASSSVPHQRLGFSNFGSRIDCYAWGENVDTCGDGWTGNATSTYTSGFGGTSGATPIIAGAALILQSRRVSQNRPRYWPDQMRSLLSSPKLGTLSANPATDRIGVMPNLKTMLSQGRKPWWFYGWAWAWMIVVGGLLITPGGVWCIKCGRRDPGYIGDTLVNVLGVGAIAIGVTGFVRQMRERSSGVNR
jgi:hypothetical protein